MPPRLPRRNEMKAGRGFVLRQREREKVAMGQMRVVGKTGVAFYKDIALDKTKANRLVSSASVG